jgi:hypothetical protein
MGTWLLFVLLTAAALLFRWQGDPWLVVVAKLSLLVGLAMVTVAVFGGAWLRFW